MLLRHVSHTVPHSVTRSVPHSVGLARENGGPPAGSRNTFTARSKWASPALRAVNGLREHAGGDGLHGDILHTRHQPPPRRGGVQRRCRQPRQRRGDATSRSSLPTPSSRSRSLSPRPPNPLAARPQPRLSHSHWTYFSLPPSAVLCSEALHRKLCLPLAGSAHANGRLSITQPVPSLLFSCCLRIAIDKRKCAS